MSSSQADLNYLTSITQDIFDISGDIRILSSLSWPEAIKETFFSHRCEKLPSLDYPKVEIDDRLASLERCRKRLAGSEYDTWLEDNINCIENSLRLLQNRGNAAFCELSKTIYGFPKATLADESNSSLDLARQLLDNIKPMQNIDVGEPPAACILASTVAAQMELVVTEFGEYAPKIVIEDSLSANALASSDRIRLRKKACFSENDIQQLVEHEIFIHAATLINGKQSGNIALLGTTLPRTTKTQEGLAVFAEFVTGNMDLERLSRLAHRVIAIQMALDGADFIEVYRYFIDIGIHQDQAFENTRRVFRGGVITGGAPFTKDIVYLDGLLRVHNFMRSAIKHQKSEYLKLLFVGRLDIEDLPLVHKLKDLGLCAPPRFLPRWMKDMRFLLSYLTYSSFLNQVNMEKVNAHYAELLSALG